MQNSGVSIEFEGCPDIFTWDTKPSRLETAEDTIHPIEKPSSSTTETFEENLNAYVEVLLRMIESPALSSPKVDEINDASKKEGNFSAENVSGVTVNPVTLLEDLWFSPFDTPYPSKLASPGSLLVNNMKFTKASLSGIVLNWSRMRNVPARPPESEHEGPNSVMPRTFDDGASAANEQYWNPLIGRTVGFVPARRISTFDEKVI
jgi:hypothetical protein